MYPEIKALFVEALRSGKFKQATCALREVKLDTKRGKVVKVESFCAAGVLCELHRIHTGQGHWSNGFYYTAKGGGAATTIPREVAKWAGLNETDDDIIWEQTVGGEKVTVSMIDLNDRVVPKNSKNETLKQVYGFKRLATAIEKYVPTKKKRTKK